MASANDVDERALSRVDADRGASANVERFPPQVERGTVELVKTAGRLQDRPCIAARDRDVDCGRDRIDQPVAGERRLQAKRRALNALGDLDQVQVDRRGIGPPIDAAADGENRTRVTQSVEATVAQACSPGLAVSERVAEKLPWIDYRHKRK